MTQGDEFTPGRGDPQEAAGPHRDAQDDAAAASPEATEAGSTDSANDAADARVDAAEALEEPADQGEDDELSAAHRQVAGLTADLQRLQAEYVNYKRRVDRDREVVRQNATYSVLTGMLPVLDDIDRAREHGEVTGGFKHVADSLERAVTALGLVRFGEPGDEFDPTLHEALMHGHSADVTTTTCDKVVQAGYRMGDRVVRAARVTVVDPEPAGAPDDEAGERPAP